jgi:hypothetical protein
VHGWWSRTTIVRRLDAEDREICLVDITVVASQGHVGFYLGRVHRGSRIIAPNHNFALRNYPPSLNPLGPGLVEGKTATTTFR